MFRIAVGFALITGCSTQTVKISNVKTDVIHQAYSISYTSDDDTTKVYARLRVGGSTGTNLELEPGSSLTCNSQPMHGVNMWGQLYTVSIKGIQPSYELMFKDTAGVSFTNRVSLEPIDFAPDTPLIFGSVKDYEVRFVGKPLAKGESIHLRITSTAVGNNTKKEIDVDPLGDPQTKTSGDSFITTITTSDEGTTSVTVKASDLASLRGGPANLQWKRTMSIPLQQGTPTGGTISSTYSSSRKNVTIEK